MNSMLQWLKCSGVYFCSHGTDWSHGTDKLHHTFVFSPTILMTIWCVEGM